MSEYDGPERRAGYKELKEEMEAHVGEIQDRFRRFYVMSLVSFACIGLTTVAGLLSFGFILREHDKTNKAVAAQAAAIQRQRESFIRDTCVESNRRHELALRELREDLVGADDLDHDIYEVLNREINLLHPKQDCDRLVRESVLRGP